MPSDLLASLEAESALLAEKARALATEATAFRLLERAAAHRGDPERGAEYRAAAEHREEVAGECEALRRDLADVAPTIAPPPKPEEARTPKKRPGKAPDALSHDEVAAMLDGAHPAVRVEPPAPARLLTAVDPAARCRLKEDVARANAEFDGEALQERRDALHIRHQREFDRDGYVYGFAAGHRMPPGEWLLLADVYALASRAFAVKPSARPEEKAAQRRAVAAIGGLFEIARRPAGSGLNRDEDVSDLLRDWNATPATGEVKDLLTLARGLDGKASGAESEALAALARKIEDGVEGEALADAAEAVLRAGVKPSDPRLRPLLLDHIEDLDDDGRSSLTELVRELTLERDRHVQEEAREEEGFADAEYQSYLEAVLPRVRGKRLMILGGDARPASRDAIRRELELAEVEWPGSHKATNVNTLYTPMEHADIVAHLTGFSRKAYKAVAKAARDQGKMVVKLNRSFNPRRFVYEIHRQVLLGEGE